jgi:N-acylglucosamine 2-epimerase
VKDHAARYREALLDDTLPFWFPRCVDDEHGGYFTCLDRDGTLVDTDKSVWQQGRTAWLLAKLYAEVEPRDEWLRACRSGIELLERHGTDEADGRMWFHLTREGRPLRKRRYAYSEAFASLAFGAFAKVSGEDWARERAETKLRRFLEHVPSPAKGTDVRPSKSLGVPMITIATCQELRESIGLADADAHIDRAIDEIRRDFVKPELGAVMETVGLDGAVLEHFDGRTLNPGHALECGWFLLREAEQRGDAELVRLGCDVIDWTFARGWDAQHGGLLYFVDLHGRPVQEYWHDMKFWWPHAEAILAVLYAFVCTGDERYARLHDEVHEWAHAHFHDPEHGEWFGYLHRDGSRSSTLKGNLWKGPFHLPRMQLFAADLCERASGLARE